MEHMSCRRSGSQPELGQHTNGPGNCWCVHVLCSCFDKNGIFTLISVLYNEIHGQLLHLIWYTAHMFSQHDGCNGRTFSEHGHASYVKVLWYLTNVQFPAAKGQPGTVLPQKRHGWPGDPTWKSSARKPNLQLPPGRLETSGDIWRLELWRTISPSPIRVGQGVVWKLSATDSGRNVAAGMQAFTGKVQVEV